MFKFKKTDRFDDELDRLFKYMGNEHPASESYRTMIQNLDILCKARSYKKDRAVNPEVLIAVGGNILGIGMILGYERVHVVASKALGFVARPKI